MPVITLPRAPLRSPIVVGDPNSTPVKSVPWRDWFDHLKVVVDTVAAASAGSAGTAILEGSHAARLALYPAVDNPESIYIETDRNRVMYISDGVNWNYQGGTIITTLAGMLAIAAGLGIHDKNLTFYSVLFDRTYQWDGTAIGEINARDRSIHMCAEAPSTAGYALCDGSTVTRSRPDGTTYSWVTPDLTGLYPKFESSYSGVAGAAAGPTLHVTSKIPAGTLTHNHDYHGSTGNAVDNDNAPWVHLHIIAPDDVTTTIAYDGSALDGSDPWVITGDLSGDAAIGGTLDMPEHQHQFATNTSTGPAKNGDGDDWAVEGVSTGYADLATVPLSGSVSTGISVEYADSCVDVAAPIPPEFGFFFTEDVARCFHSHTAFLVDGTVGFGDSNHQHTITDLPFSDTSADHVHFLDELESGPVVAGPVAIDLDTLTVDVSDMAFTSTTHEHHHEVTISGITGDAVDNSGEDPSPHHHTYEGTTDDSTQLADFFCTVVATADANQQQARMGVMGYISL